MTSPVGLHRVLRPGGVLPQAATRLDASREIGPDEVRIRVERLNLDAASFRQLATKHGGDGTAVRAEVLDIIATRGKMQNPVTGSGGMLIGTVDEVGPPSPLGLKPGDRVATLVSLTLTPLAITDGLARWDGRGEQVPCTGHAILFGRSIAAVLPEDLDPELALAVLDVCGAPALTARVVRGYRAPTVAVLGGAGKSGSLSLAAARRAGAGRTIGVVPNEAEATPPAASGPAHGPADPNATALVVRDGVLAWLGTDADAPGGADETVDLDGRWVAPAFVDAHVHTTSTGIALLGLDLSGTRSAGEVIERLAKHAAEHPADRVVIGHGWDESGWPVREPPSASEIGRAADGRPVYLSRVDAHSAVVSTALLATVTPDEPGWDPAGWLAPSAHHAVRRVALDAVSAQQRADAQRAALGHA